MKCAKCGENETKVLESRLSHEGRSVRRRRLCQACNHRWTTYEKEEEFVFSIRKKDGRVEPYQRAKVTNAIQVACRKRNITVEEVESIVLKMEKQLQEAGDRTVASDTLGDLVMKQLHGLDKVAYVRWASVYKDFKDPTEFMSEIRSLEMP